MWAVSRWRRRAGVGERMSEVKSWFEDVNVKPNSTAVRIMRRSMAESLLMLTIPNGIFLHWLRL